MVREVCAQCPAHGHTDINFQSAVRNRVASRKKRSAILCDLIGDYDLIFPVGRFLSQKTFEGYNYIPVVEVPGFVLMTVTRNKDVLCKNRGVLPVRLLALLYYLHLNDAPRRNRALDIGK